MTTPRTVDIGGIPVGPDHPPFVIAEMSGNHDGSLSRALDLVRAAADAGAHALKLQTYTADTLTLDADGPEFRLSDDHPLWGGRRLYDLYAEAATPWDWHEPIFDLAHELGMVAFATPFDPTAVDFLAKLGVPVLKNASSEITDLPLLRRMAETGLPVIVSTGTATLAEIDAAVRTVRGTGNDTGSSDDVIVLGCTVSYPAPPSASNLRSLPVMRDALDVVVGLSDHTPGIGAAVAAVALGACVIEKHLTLDRTDGGVDSAFSLEPHELSALVVESRRAWEALGGTRIGPRDVEREGLRFRRSLFVAVDVEPGDVVDERTVRSVRPADGLAPITFDELAGRRFTRRVAKGTPMSWDLV